MTKKRRMRRMCTECRARYSGGGLEMNALDAALVKRLNAAIAAGSFAGFDSSPENLRIKGGTMEFVPLVRRSKERPRLGA